MMTMGTTRGSNKTTWTLRTSFEDVRFRAYAAAVPMIVDKRALPRATIKLTFVACIQAVLVK
ncbi:hypothetical protein Brsp01_49540 [Brucella sp. NBRC 12950]|nr:hypothetical protein Brsp01_49540 [Brucella sp. NBRC 12950]